MPPKPNLDSDVFYSWWGTWKTHWNPGVRTPAAFYVELRWMDTDRFRGAAQACINECDSFPSVKKIKAMYFLQAPVRTQNRNAPLVLSDGTEIPKLTTLHPGEIEDYRDKLEARYADCRERALQADKEASMNRPLAAAAWGTLARMIYIAGEHAGAAWAGRDSESGIPPDPTEPPPQEPPCDAELPFDEGDDDIPF